MHGVISQNISIYILKLCLFCLGGTGTCIMPCVRESDNLLASPSPTPHCFVALNLGHQAWWQALHPLRLSCSIQSLFELCRELWASLGYTRP